MDGCRFFVFEVVSQLKLKQQYGKKSHNLSRSYLIKQIYLMSFLESIKEKQPKTNRNLKLLRESTPSKFLSKSNLGLELSTQHKSSSLNSSRYGSFIKRLKSESNSRREKEIEFPILTFEGQSQKVRKKKVKELSKEKSKISENQSNPDVFFTQYYNQCSNILNVLYKKNPNRKLTLAELVLQQTKKLPKNYEEKQLLQKDAQMLEEEFRKNFNHQICMFKYFSQKIKSWIGKLLFYIGLSLDMKMRQIIENVYRIKDRYQMLHYQIYFSLKIGIPEICLRSLKKCGQMSLENKQYELAQHYFQKLLKIALVTKSKDYEQIAIDKMGICEYYKGNICEAEYFHNNIGKMTEESKIKYCQNFSIEKYLRELYMELIDNKGTQFRLKVDENQKYLIIFQNPKPRPKDYFNIKLRNTVQNILEMQKGKRTKKMALIMRRRLISYNSIGRVIKTEENNEKQEVKKTETSEIIFSKNHYFRKKGGNSAQIIQEVEVFLAVLTQLS